MLKEDLLYLFAERIRKEVRIMPTIFPREEKAEALFDKIVKDPRACKRLMDAFYEGVACDEDGNITESDIHISESKRHMFTKLVEKNRYLAYGFLEQHSFKEDMSIQTIQNESHLGILVVQEMPEELHEKLSDAQIYSGLWDSMMKLEDLLYNAFFYCGDFKGKYCVGVFLPFTHFEHNLEKNIEVSNSILYECIQKMLND